MHDQINQATPASEATDSKFAQEMHGLLSEAAERVTFHRVEVERWARVGRAASAAINHLQSAQPVAKMAPDAFLSDEPEQAAKW